MYKTFLNTNDVIIGTGSPIIITGWTLKTTVANKIPSNKYAAIGNLYSIAGINNLFRNLLYNADIPLIICLNQTKQDKTSGSLQCLNDFFMSGYFSSINQYGQQVWQIKSDYVGYLDHQFEEDDLAAIAANVKLMTLSKLNDLVNVVTNLDVSKSMWQDYTPRKIEFTKHESVTIPSRSTGILVSDNDVGNLWLKVVNEVFKHGASNNGCRELVNVMAVLESGVCKLPDYIKELFGLTPDYLYDYNQQITGVSLKKEGVKYTYGDRMRRWFGHDQIKSAIRVLKDSPTSRRVVINLWDSLDDISSDNPPCLNHIWLYVVNNQLYLTATFRSHDIFAAWIPNIYGLHCLQSLIAGQLSLELGKLTMVSQSAHIYNNKLNDAAILLDSHLSKITKPTYSDPTGNFLISCDYANKLVVVEQYDQLGEYVTTYRGKVVTKLLSDILVNNSQIDRYHIGYLGAELERAKSALVSNVKYEQDK